MGKDDSLIAVIASGTGTVGEGIVRAFLASREASMVNGGVIQLGNRPPLS